MTQTAERTARFRGKAASSRSQHLTAGAAVIATAACAIAGLMLPATALAFFAVGAGAGYSLSGSV